MTSKKNIAKKPVTSVMEDYLEAIYELDQKKKVVRVRDIAKQMGVKMPTVSSMLNALNNRGLINYKKYEYVELTRRGKGVGKKIRNRHEVMFKFLSEILEIKSQIADEEACKIEHALSSTTLKSLTDLMEFMQTCPPTGQSWRKYLKKY